MKKLRVLDLFSGIGGFSLGLERIGGFETVAFCEIEEYPRRVLAKHWPKVPCYDDVRTLTADTLRRDGIAVDVICGGFPCQDISGAGRKVGIDGSRSGLWSDYARLVGEIRPEYVIVENVADLLVRGIDRVLGGLATLGYDAEWHCIPACAVGAPHERDRVWVIAYSKGQSGRCGVVENRRQQSDWTKLKDGASDGRSGLVAYAKSIRRGAWWARRSDPSSSWKQKKQQPQVAADAAPMFRPSFVRKQQDRALREHWSVDWQSYASSLRGMDDGVSGRIHGLAALGNAVVPQIPELIGNAILASLGATS
mgnify:CR=1 FL=1